MLARISARYARSGAACGARSAFGATTTTTTTTKPTRAFSAAAGSDLFNPTEEHRMLRDAVRGWTEELVDPQALEYNREEKLNLPLLRRTGSELGVMGTTVPTEFGGAGMDAVASCIVHEELSAADPAFCLAYLAHSLLFVNNLAVNGNDEQRHRLLPAACAGEIIGGMCMSEPGAGTDVLGMSTTAERSDDGSYTLNGSKMWITNGALDDTTLGDAFLVYAQTGGVGAKSLSLFIVEKGAEGFGIGTRIKEKLGMRASTTAELYFDNVRVPAENLVGQEGDAVLCMMRNLEIERLALGAMSLGIARRSIEVMNRYAQERVAFGSPLSEFGQIQALVADSYAEYMAGRAYVYNTAASLALDSTGNRVDTDGVKLFCSKMGTRVADRAIQVLGGNGYTGEYQVERLWRDAKLLEIGGGTVESHQKNMSRDMRKWERLP